MIQQRQSPESPSLYSRIPQFWCVLLRWCALACLLVPALAQAQIAGSPFTCDVVFYQMRNLGANSLPIKFAAVNATVTPTAVYTAVRGTLINSIGYNPVDNYIYGIRAATGTPQLYRIGQSGYQLVGNIITAVGGASLAGFIPTAGVFDAGGRFYFAGQSGLTPNNITPAAIFRVDFIPTTGNVQVAHEYAITPTPVINFGDFDFNGAGSPNGLLLASVNSSHFRINLAAGATPVDGTATVATLALAPDVGGIGSAFYDAFTSRFYVFNNTTNQFWQILNPQAGTPSAVNTPAVTYTGPPPFSGSFSSTDGTSCPISGTRVADLRITKTDGLTSVPPGGAVVAYTITVVNGGPYPANYAVVRDAPASGVTKLSVTCSAPGGPPTAVCPPTLSISSLEAGVPVLTFPPDTTLVFTLNAQITGSIGTTISNTATVTPAIDTTESNPANNTAVDGTLIAGTATNIITAAHQCGPGKVENLTNLLTNGDFSGTFLSDATILANEIYPTPQNSVSRQVTHSSYLGGAIVQNPFPGDPSRSIAGSPNWLLSNGHTGAAVYRPWYQAVTGLTVGKTYQFMAYVSNATVPDSASPTLPSLRLGTASIATFLPGSNVALANETVSPGDTWRLIQGTFTAVATATTVSIADFSGAVAADTGGVAGIAAATLRECSDAANLSVTKTNGATTITTSGTTAYTITVANISTINATNTTIIDPAVPGLIKVAISCTASAGSSCPTPLTISVLETTGLTIPLVEAGDSVVFRITTTVAAGAGSTVTNAVSVAGVGYTDSDPSNNSAQDTDLVVGSALVAITKTNAVSALTAGGTTSYTITVGNSGPDTVSNAVFRDAAVPGLQCTAITCTGTTGPANCPLPANLTIAALQGAGISLPSMVSPSTLTFRVDCNVTATGVP